MVCPIKFKLDRDIDHHHSCQNWCFYCLNTSYPMDNCFTGRHDRSRQLSEKDVLYIIPAGPARRVHSPGGASYFLFLSRHLDVIASFSFGVWRVKMCFHDKRIFVTTPYTSILFHLKEVLQYYLQLCLPQDRDEVPAVTLWLGLTPTPSVHVVEIRGWVTTLASSRKNVMSVRGLPLIRSSNYQHPPTENEKTRRRLRPPLLPLSWILHT